MTTQQVDQIKYNVRGVDPRTGERKLCVIGWSPVDNYFFIDGNEDVVNNLRYLGELHIVARQWQVMDLRVFQAMRRAEVDWWIANNPSTQATAELEALQAGRTHASVR